MQTDERRGLGLAICGFALLSVGDAVVKSLAGDWSPVAAAALRFALGALALSVLLYHKEGVAGFRPRDLRLQLARGFCLAGASIAMFSAFFLMPLATAMALSFVSPVFAALLSGPLLGEKVRKVVWIVSPIALIGVALILRPNLASLGWAILLPLASALLFSLMVIANRASAGQGSALSMQTFIALGATPFLIAAAALGHWTGAAFLQVEMPGWTVVARCAIVAATASTAHWLIYLATERAGAATVAPTTYVQMLVATALGYAVFGDVPDGLTLAGAALIIGAGLYLWWRTPAGKPRAD